MTDDLHPAFLRKVERLEVVATKGDPKATMKEIVKLRRWLATDASLQQMRMFHALVTYLWQSYADRLGLRTRDAFYEWLKREAGHCQEKISESTVDGVRVIHHKFRILSLAFHSCPQKTRNAVIQRIFDGVDAWFPGFRFAEWEREWSTNEGTLQ